jgi:glycosyltransferase involved in cell wall biosynthesis
MKIGIDASTIGSGGAKRHLTELLKNASPTKNNFEHVVLWASADFLNSLPSYTWLIKKPQFLLGKNFIFKFFWQFFVKEYVINSSGIDLLFCPFGTYIGRFKPYVTMSRNMLIFDKIERNRFSTLSSMRLKLCLLNLIQTKSFKDAAGIIFISNYAKRIILSQIGLNGVKSTVINHGVSLDFINPPKIQNKLRNSFKLLYVSSIWPYKHHLNIIKAVKNLHAKGIAVELIIVGNPDYLLTSSKISQALTDVNYITWHQNIGLDGVVEFYKKADGFIFASTCENMPNILIEAMAAGLPICSSNYEPMPEFLQESALYFDPLSIESIEYAIFSMVSNDDLRIKVANEAYELSKSFSWETCTFNTFYFLNETLKSNE